VSDDHEYDDMERTERKAKRLLKANHYREITLPPCCKNCKHVEVYDPDEHDDYGCGLAHNDKWNVAGVSTYGLCDKYEARKP
jgi:predicted nucleic-acid-binding Zn-ribbon protein